MLGNVEKINFDYIVPGQLIWAIEKILKCVSIKIYTVVLKKALKQVLKLLNQSRLILIRFQLL